MIVPLGGRIAVYQSVRGWAAVYFIADNMPTREAAQAAADTFRTPYGAGWRDGLADMLTLWLETAKSGATWSTLQVSDWLAGLVKRLAPQGPKSEA